MHPLAGPSAFVPAPASQTAGLPQCVHALAWVQTGPLRSHNAHAPLQPCKLRATPTPPLQQVGRIHAALFCDHFLWEEVSAKSQFWLQVCNGGPCLVHTVTSCMPFISGLKDNRVSP